MKFCSITIRINLFLFLLIPLFSSYLTKAQATAIQTQSSTFSPYSRYGIGTMEPSGYAAIAGLGGSYTAYQNDTLIPLFINSGNPASYSTNRLTTFEFGMKGSSTNFNSDSGTVKKKTVGFKYISLAFPIRKNMGAAFGLQPFSNVGYNSTTYSNVDSVGQVKYNYQGTGGVNQVFLGFAIRPFDKTLRDFYKVRYYMLIDSFKYKEITKEAFDTLSENKNYKVFKKSKYQTLLDCGKYRTVRHNRFWRRALSSLSLGTNVSFLFGTIDYYSYAYLPYSYGSVFNTEQYTETVLHDVYYQGGAQMAFDIDSIGHYNLKNNLKIILGYSISLPKNVATTATQVAYNFSSQSNNVIQPFDTFYNKPSTKGSIYIPLMQSVGLGFKSGDKVTVLLDGGYQQWSKFLGFGGDNQHMRDLYKASIGIQYLPSRVAMGQLAYIKKINYRIGVRYNTGNIVLNNKSIGDYAFSAGLGLPAGGGRFRLFAMANLSGEWGVMGTSQNNLVQEKYFKFTIGLTFNDRWFLKTKYD
jgi:hypothetical protein